MNDSATPPATPPAASAAASMTDPSKVLHRTGVSRSIRTALIAVGIAWAIALVFSIVYLILDFVWMISYGFDDLPEAFGDFGEAAIVDPLLFFVGAGALLVVLLPILPETRLLTVMIRAALAGLGGFVLLTLKGLAEAISDATSYTFGFGYFVYDWFGYPLAVALDLTALLVIGAVVAWLFASKRAAVAA